MGSILRLRHQVLLAWLVQRLYLEVRHAVRQLCVREGDGGAGAGAWYAVERGGLKRKPVDASSLPGPWGGQKLHVQTRQANGEGEGSDQLPKVCRNSSTRSQYLVLKVQQERSHASHDGDTESNQ